MVAAMTDFKPTTGKTLAGILRDALFYSNDAMRQSQLGHPVSVVASVFARAISIVLDGRSHMLGEPSPHAGIYSASGRNALLFRAWMGDAFALRLLQANYYHHFEQKAD